MSFKFVLAALAAVVSLALMPGSASAQFKAQCEAQALSKDGKPLSGAAKNSSVKKCMKDSCEASAVDKNGKKLAGAAKASFLKKCEAC